MQQNPMQEYLVKNPHDAQIIENAINADINAVKAIEHAINANPAAVSAIERAISSNPKATLAIKRAINKNPEAIEAIKKAINSDLEATNAIKKAINTDSYATSCIERAINAAGEETIQTIQGAIDANPDAVAVVNKVFSGEVAKPTKGAATANAFATEYIKGSATNFGNSATDAIDTEAIAPALKK